jgi:tetratricopeptide (TPR) repeat protein
VKRLTPFLLSLLLLAGCAAPAETPRQRLPTRALTATPTEVPIPARRYYEQGLAYQRAGDLERAEEAFTQALTVDADFAPAYVARGTVYLAQRALDRALEDAQAALGMAPGNAAAYALRGETLRLLDRPRAAATAFDRAVALDEDLGEATFRSRWLIARALEDEERMLDLGREYAADHPEDPQRAYYRGWALIELQTPLAAIHTLSGAIRETSDASALLWFALGRAYAETGAWSEALTCFENARALVERGDMSLQVHTDQPVALLFNTLGQAYLRVGRCVDAEVMLEYAATVGEPVSAYTETLEEVRACQTPTPTATPYPTTTPEVPPPVED